MNELPTLEGRVMADLGHQVAELRAKLQQAEAERDHVAEQLGLVYWHITGGALSKPYDFKAVESQIDDHLNEFYGSEARDADHHAEQAEADNARLRERVGQLWVALRNRGHDAACTIHADPESCDCGMAALDPPPDVTPEAETR